MRWRSTAELVIVAGIAGFGFFVYALRVGRGGQRQLLLQVIWLAARRLPVRPQPAGTDVLLVAPLADVRPVVGVQPLMQLQMHELGEFLRAQVTRERFLSAVKPQVRFEVRRGREPLLADITLVRFFAGVHEVMLLEVGQLGEGLGADVALEGPLARVRPEVDLEVGELAEGFAADVALVVHFTVTFAQRVRETSVAAGAWGSGTHGAAAAGVRASIRAEAAWRGDATGGHAVG